MSSGNGRTEEDPSSPPPTRKKMKISDESFNCNLSEQPLLSESEACLNMDIEGSHDKDSGYNVNFKAIVEKIEEMQRKFMWTNQDWENIFQTMVSYSSTSKKNESNIQSTELEQPNSAGSALDVPSMTSVVVSKSNKSITCSDNHEVCPSPIQQSNSNLSAANVVGVLNSIKQFITSQHFNRFWESPEGEAEDLHDESITSDVIREVLEFIEKVSLREVNTLNSSKKKVNPLCNDLILSHVMELLNVEDLTNCRLVSKFWSRMATPQFKKFHHKIELSCDSHLQSFCRDLEETVQFPFRYFKFRPTKVLKENVFKFFTQFGSFVEHIILQGESSATTVQQLNHFKDSLRFILHFLPNVVTVQLDDLPEQLVSCGFTLTSPNEPPLMLPNVNTLRIYSSLRDEFKKEFIRDVYKIMPNVRELGLGLPDFTSARQSIFVPPNLKLTCLHVGYEESLTTTSMEMLQHLTSHPFFFENLTFSINFDSPDEAVILEAFLKRQRNCLKTLYLQSTMDNDTRIGFPVMTELKILSIYFDDSVDSDDEENDPFVPRMLCHPFTSNQFPVLQRLDISIWCLSVLFPAANGSFPTVKSIRIGYGHCSYIKNSDYLNYFENIPPVFPKLTDFTVALADSRVLCEIFNCLQYLEELEFEYSDDTDNINSVLCGFPSSTDWISKKFAEWSKRRTHAEFETMLELFTNPPHVCLLDMKRLKKLRILGPEESICDAEIITDVSVYLAFLRMQRLDQLVLDGNASLSEEGASALKGHHTNVTIFK